MGQKYKATLEQSSIRIYIAGPEGLGRKNFKIETQSTISERRNITYMR